MGREEYKYVINTNVTLEEYQKMYKAFPINYWFNILFSTIITSLVLSVICLIDKVGVFIYIILDLIAIIFIFIYYKLNSNKIVKNIYDCFSKNKSLPKEYALKFYDNYLIKESENIKEKIYYLNIDKIIETNSNFYLRLSNRVLIITKINDNLEILDFIRNLNKSIYINKSKTSHFNNILNLKILMLALFIITLLSFPIASCLHDFFNQCFNIPVGAEIRTMWIFWLLLPIPITSFVLGNKYKYKKNIVVGIVMSLLLTIYGFFCFFPNNEVPYNSIDEYQNIINISLPNDGTYIKQEFDWYFNMKDVINNHISFGGIEDGFVAFEKGIKNNTYWILGENLSKSFELFISDENGIDDNFYYLIFNETLNQYNTLLENKGTYHMYVASYDINHKVLEIIEGDFSYN